MWRLVKPFFFSEVKWKARGMLLLLALFALSIAAINVLLSYLARDFMTAFALKERDEFFRKLGFYLLGFGLATPVTVFYAYTEQRLALMWRRWLSKEILGKYFHNLAYYKIASYEGIDNPDQRIEEDIRSFTAQSLSLFLIMVNACLTLVLFVGILWSIS
ncbi:MAG: ABC transporter ATP-binding protein, partial [Deltaproteobacteria bacterium]|nr:ABC transporter ATP-binding protein [Deltaproteobacteria bacterium]